MDIYEDLVLQYLTKDGHVFVSPQYSIRGASGGEWSCPDYVALDFRHKTVSVVEVSSASVPSSLRTRIRARDHQWLQRLREQLVANHVVNASWEKYFVDVFVRAEPAEEFVKEFASHPEVRIHVLEDLGFPWRWTRSYFPRHDDAV